LTGGQKTENGANYLLAAGFDFIGTMKRGFDIIAAQPELILFNQTCY
jgi:hypothetical protein